MNSILTDAYPLFELYQALRSQLMDLLTDADLAFTPGGANPPLGELCREIGEVQQAYIDSFASFTQDFAYRTETPGLSGSVAMLRGWYTNLDADLKAVIAGLSEEDVQTRRIDRGHDFKVPPRMQLEIYKEALLIFYGKTSVYLKLMGKELPPQWQHWIA
ncbi:MAG: DinB family protein [Anaerolineales bacterium]|nr:DinB family protein [Anaerolineales bacterium]